MGSLLHGNLYGENYPAYSGAVMCSIEDESASAAGVRFMCFENAVGCFQKNDLRSEEYFIYNFMLSGNIKRLCFLFILAFYIGQDTLAVNCSKGSRAFVTV